MKITDLYLKLKEAYSDENLNKITVSLIELFKLKQYGRIREISALISEFIITDNEKINKCFYKLIMLYHPDKGPFYRAEIEKYFTAGNSEELNRFSHILLLKDIGNVGLASELSNDIDYSPEYKWDFNLDGYGYYSDSQDDMPQEDYYYDKTYDDNSFFSALKRRIYGNIDIELPVRYLEDFDEIEMSEYEIENLDGIEYCKYATIIDLSKNKISDISNLWNLERLEELYLAENQIYLIDTLCNLMNLRIVDLADNNLDDISPLFKMGKMEFLNITGNNVPVEQINKLKEKGIVVIH